MKWMKRLVKRGDGRYRENRTVARNAIMTIIFTKKIEQ